MHFSEMKLCLLLGVVAVALTSPVTDTEIKQTISKTGGISPQLTFIVTIDGKSFFVDGSARRSWAQAATYCKDMGMRLASITSSSQFAALNSVVLPEFPDGGVYWTSGRESQEISQFRWDYNGSPLSESHISFERRSGVSYQSCVEYWKKDKKLKNESCNYANYGVLCETT